MLRHALVVVLLAVAAPAMAQELDLQQIFSNDRFFKESGILKARGDVDFVADVWLLPGSADSSRALIGISLSNGDLRFVRVEGGGWRASYAVVAEIDPHEGEKIQRRWEKSLDLASFDETLVPGETIVFQAELPLSPGKYRFKLTVTDQNADESGRVDGELEVPPAGGAVLAEPVLLRELGRQGDDVEYIVHPSHVFPAPPEKIEFMIAGKVPGAAGSVTARARLIKVEAKDEAESIGTWSDSLALAPDGSFVTFGSIDSHERLGEYRVEVDLVDAAGAAVAHAQTPLLIAGLATWIADHWKDALSLIRYEATKDEMKILEDIDDPAQRIEAWTCFWRMRDPIPTTAVNEAMQEYLGRIQTANKTWTSALRGGYLSDRARVYVTLGPPDDIQTNPMPRGDRAYEVWTYLRGREFQIVFVDRIGFNNYQLDSIATYQRELGLIERRKQQFLRDRAQLCPVLQPAFEKKD